MTLFPRTKSTFTEMRDKPLVSVVIIFLNVGEFLKEAIESVFARTYDPWGLFLVDDADYFIDPLQAVKGD